MVEFQDAQYQDVLVDGSLRVHIEFELRDECRGREFRNRLVVGCTLDFRMLHLVRDRCRGAVGKDFRFVFFFGRSGRRRGDALFDGDGRHEVADCVLLRHEPEGEPEVHDLPAELFQDLRTDVVAVFDRVAETFRGAVVLDERQVAVRIVRVDNDGTDGDSAAGEAFFRLDVLAGECLEYLFAERRCGRRCRVVCVVFLVLQVADPFAEKGVLLVVALCGVCFRYENLQFLFSEGRADGDLVVACNFRFTTNEDDIPETVDGAVRRLYEETDVRVRAREKCRNGGASQELGANGVFDFATGGLVECDDSESLFGVALGVLQGGLRNGVHLVFDDLESDSLERFAARRRELLDAVVVDMAVGESDECGIAVQRREPELAGRDALPECRCQDAFLEEGRVRERLVLEGVKRLELQRRIVRVADKDGLACCKNGRDRFGDRDAVGIQDERDVKRGLLGNAEGVAQRKVRQGIGILFDGLVQFAEVCVAELVQKFAVRLAFLGTFLGRLRKQVRAGLGDILDLFPAPAGRHDVDEFLVRIFGIGYELHQTLARVAFHFLEQGGQLHVDVEVVPVFAPRFDPAEPFFDAQAFERSVQFHRLVDLLDGLL